jgi:hypothetical protein
MVEKSWVRAKPQWIVRPVRNIKPHFIGRCAEMHIEDVAGGDDEHAARLGAALTKIRRCGNP